jgi:LmbE family N-acetylglucosaminyl deacetylase
MEAMSEDWDRGLAIVAHPDDMEYGAAAAVARWTHQGKSFTYVLVSDGEAGMTNVAPAEAGPIRRGEQRASCAVVGVTDVEFLGWPDGTIVEGVDLRADLAAAIRRHRPQVVVSINYRDTWDGGGWNHADHRAVGRALLDAVRDAANPWVFADRGPAWSGVRFVAFNASPQAMHAVDTTDSFDLGVKSLAAHRMYLDNLSGEMASPEELLRRQASVAGARLGAELAATFEVVS